MYVTGALMIHIQLKVCSLNSLLGPAINAAVGICEESWVHSSQKPLSQAGITGDRPIHQMCPFLFIFNYYFIILNYFGGPCFFFFCMVH